jgi:predicted nucleotidyltransferase
MSADPKIPPAPRLRAIRETWLRRAIERLEADPAVSATGLVGSLGRGDADDWSDVDLLIVVPDGQVVQNQRITGAIDAHVQAETRSPAPLEAANVLPVCRRSWTCSLRPRSSVPRAASRSAC